MTTQYPDAQYIRVRHLGNSTGSLYLADLDDEDNKRENKGVPVYVPEGGSIDIPLDEDTLHSYQQGTIRGMIDQNLASANIIEDTGAAVVWISPDGDNENPGSRNAPFYSLAHAVDYLQTNFEDDVVKQVRWADVTGGFSPHDDTLTVINRPNVQILGDDFSQYVDLYYVGPIVVTNMTKEAAEAFYADGGMSIDEDGTSFTYTGASLEDRDIVPGSDGVYNINTVFRGLRIHGSDEIGLCTVAAPTEGSQTNILLNVMLDNCQIGKVGDKVPSLYAKNSARVAIHGTVIDKNNPAVFDNCALCSVNAGRADSIWAGSRLIMRADDTLDGTEGVGLITNNPMLYFHPKGPVGDFTTYGNVVGSLHDSLRGKGYGNLDVSGDLTLRGGIGLPLDRLTCASLAKHNADADLEIGQLQCRGAVTISAGATNIIKGGSIEGNLTVDGGCTAVLSGVTIHGDVIVEGDNTDLTLDGCHIKGAINVDVANDNSGISVVMNGGTYMGSLTDPGAAFTRNAGS